MITHGILLTAQDPIIQLTEQILYHPEIAPTTEGKECWEDRTGFKPKVRSKKYSPVCGRGLSVYKERWR